MTIAAITKKYFLSSFIFLNQLILQFFYLNKNVWDENQSANLFLFRQVIPLQPTPQ